ncbi:MAG: hypothetical protein AAGH88_00580 [Planctomycetota bacterium]
MPYVDQGEPKPAITPPVVPLIAIAAAMGLAIVPYWFFYNNLNLNQWLAPLLVGPMIGGAIFFTKKQPVPRSGLIVIIATLVTCLVGYVLRHVLWIKWADPTFKPSVGHAFEWLFSFDLVSILLMAMSAYFAFAIATIPKQTAPPAE